MFYKKVNLFYEPEKICNKIISEENKNYSEMTVFQQAFLCGMIKENKPKKILEIGVAAGGTTAVMLSCLKMLDFNSEMYSVDICEKWYRTGESETGFVAKKFMNQIVGNTKHKFLLGKAIPYIIDEIGKGIDFLILDTTHAMPGELLDFLICLPYLEDGCVVILHDVMENHMACNDNEISTKLLFNLVQGDKWYMQEDELDAFGYSNISAFRVDKKMHENINSLFFALTFSWMYLLEDVDAKKYEELLGKHYGYEYMENFRKILELQNYTNIRKSINRHYHMGHEILRMKWKKMKNVCIYGVGYWSNIYSEYAKINNLPISSYVVSNDQNIDSICINGKPVYRLKDLPYDVEECSFILALDSKHFPQIKRNLNSRGYYMIL